MDDIPVQFVGEGGTTAAVTYYDDSGMHDSTIYTYTVHLRFSDPVLNPPNDGYWEAGRLDCHFKQFKPQMALEVAQKFYDFLMTFRTAYGLESTVNAWRERYEIALKEVERQQEIVMTIGEELDKHASRIKELENDYVHKLEAQIVMYKRVINSARQRALQEAKLLTLDE